MERGLTMSRGPAVRLRRAVVADAGSLLAWANDPATREASLGRPVISWEDHAAWLEATLADPARRLWIVEVAGSPVGQVRVDRQQDGVGLVSIGLAPDARGRGLGRLALRRGLEAARGELGIGRARAVVSAANEVSRRLFERAGFTVVGPMEIAGRRALVLEADLGAAFDDEPRPMERVDEPDPVADRARPRAVLRADASLRRGTGHVVRSLTLGAALREAGWAVSLLTRELPRGLRASVEAAGVQAIQLPPSLPPDGEPEFLAGTMRGPVTLLVADQYEIGEAWLEHARPHAATLLAIDDLADRRLPVDILLNQNLGARAAQYRRLVPPSARILAGPTYALIRPEFASLRARRRKRTGLVDRVLVFMSGADEHDVTRRAASGVVAAGVAVDVVVGSAYPHLAALRSWATEEPLAAVHADTPEMAALMDRADLAIGAPSSASWERCTLGLPSVLVTLADNQRDAERCLVERGAACTLGWHTTVTEDDVRQAVTQLRDDPRRVRAMSRAAAAVTDGQGTSRVVTAIEDVTNARGSRAFEREE